MVGSSRIAFAELTANRCYSNSQGFFGSPSRSVACFGLRSIW
jgi:hypothetical protein